MASYITAVKAALEKKHAAQHPDAKPAKGSKSAKKTTAPQPMGKPVPRSFAPQSPVVIICRFNEFEFL